MERENAFSLERVLVQNALQLARNFGVPLAFLCSICVPITRSLLLLSGTVGTGEAFRYIVIHPVKHDFEAKNPGALFVALSRAKSAGGEGMDPDFAFHEDVLLNVDRLRPVNTPTTRARAVEMERLHVLATQCQEREMSTPAYRDGIYLRLVEWAQSQSH